MIHVRHLKVKLPRSQRGPLYGFYAASGLGPPNVKEQLRRGVGLATVSSVLLLVGSILTWLVFTEVFGSKVPIMGPLVLALGMLLLVLAIRQFFIVWKHKRRPSEQKPECRNASEGGGEEGDADMMEMDTWDTEGHKTSYTEYSYQYSSQCSDPQCNADRLSPLPTIPALSYTDPATLSYILPHQPQSPLLNQMFIPQPPVPILNPPHPSSAMLMRMTATSTPSLSGATTSITTATTNLDTPTTVHYSDNKVRSCSDLMRMGSSQEEKPNPRPAVRYSQGQLELLDRQTMGTRTSSSSIVNISSHHSPGERSNSTPQEPSGLCSLSVEHTDILETI